MARATASTSAFTKFSTTGSPVRHWALAPWLLAADVGAFVWGGVGALAVGTCANTFKQKTHPVLIFIDLDAIEFMLMCVTIPSLRKARVSGWGGRGCMVFIRF
jgi:hypothetical protein